MDIRARTEHSPQMMAMLAAKRGLNMDAMIYLATALGGFITVISLTRFITILARRPLRSLRGSAFARPLLCMGRFLKRSFIRKVPGLPSAGHAWICVTYIGLNVALVFEPLMEDWKSSWMSHVGSKTGWLAIANICLTIFLSLKNTPLGWLTGWTYERLNVFHRVVGYVTLAMVSIHGATYTAYFPSEGNAARLRVVEEVYGMVAGGAMLTLAIAAVILRRRYYEAFYVIHVSFFVVAVTFISLHQPETSKDIVFAAITGAGTWVLDRLVRGIRVLVHSHGNAATIHPLPDGGTQIMLRKTPMGARPGHHCFVWIPGIRTIEMHPFTIIWIDPLGFVASSKSGFTRDLHDHAVKHPGARLRASVDGPYGKCVDTTAYDTVVMIAGGSGASYPLSVALDMERQGGLDSRQRIVFVWVVRDQCRLEWFRDHLRTIGNIPNLSASVFVTGPPRPGVTGRTPYPPCVVHLSAFGPRLRAPEESDAEKLALEPQAQPEMVEIEDASGGREPDAASDSFGEEEPATHIDGIPITYARPCVSSTITSAVGRCTDHERVLVLGCGPEGLMADVRSATAGCISSCGPAVDLHCEIFGW